jgi:hypothetical protein
MMPRQRKCPSRTSDSTPWNGYQPPRGSSLPARSTPSAPGDAAELARATRRRDFIERVFAGLGTEGQAMARAAAMPAHSRTLAELQRD